MRLTLARNGNTIDVYGEVQAVEHRDDPAQDFFGSSIAANALVWMKDGSRYLVAETPGEVKERMAVQSSA